MNQITNKRLHHCVFINLILFIIIVLSIIFLKEENNTYFNFGPNENLFILSVKINTYKKYIILQIYLCIIEIVRVIVNDIASPILAFNVYNPDKKVITDFTKNELQILTNTMWIINSLTTAMFVVVTISQIDIALLRVVYSELTQIYTVRILLNEKKFITNNYFDGRNYAMVELENV
jgi:hypothetical protein